MNIFDPKILSLVILTLQNTLLVLTMKISLMYKDPNEPAYLPSVVVMADEIMKLIFCVFMIMWAYKSSHKNQAAGYALVGEEEIDHETLSVSGFMKFFKHECFRTAFDFFKMAIPAICYAVQKNLLFVAISNLDAAVFQVAYQGKILSTAMFAVIMLRKKLTTRQVFALFVLLFGVALVQVSSSSESSSKTGEGNVFIGTVAVVLSCVISGFAAIYFEWILKKGPKEEQKSYTLWVRNFQLAIFAGAAAAVGVWTKDGKAVSDKGLFQGFNGLVWFVTFLEAFGGIVVALVIKYADNIAKNFSTAVSIVTSVIVSAIFLGFKITPTFVIGACIVMLAIVIYTSDPTKPLLARSHEKDESPTKSKSKDLSKGGSSPMNSRVEMGLIKPRSAGGSPRASRAEI